MQQQIKQVPAVPETNGHSLTRTVTIEVPEGEPLKHWTDRVSNALTSNQIKFGKFEQSVEGRKRSVLPAIKSAADDGLPEHQIEEPPQVIKDVLYSGCKLVLGSTSKGKKTWVLIDLAIAVATGGKWLGHLECSKGNVLYLNLELIPYTFQQRRKRISKKQGVESPELAGLHYMDLKGYGADIATMVEPITEAAESGNYSLIILDPIYKVYGGRDENGAGAMGELVNHLERICTKTGAALAFAAHFPKGDLSARSAMDRISGSGVFARDPEAVITMSPPKKPDTYGDKPTPEEERELEMILSGDYLSIDAVLRDFPPVPAFTVKWEFPVFNHTTHLDPADRKKRNQATRQIDKDLAHTNLCQRTLNWLRKNCPGEGISHEAFRLGSKAATSNKYFIPVTKTLQDQGFITRTHNKAPWFLVLGKEDKRVETCSAFVEEEPTPDLFG